MKNRILSSPFLQSNSTGANAAKEAHTMCDTHFNIYLLQASNVCAKDAVHGLLLVNLFEPIPSESIRFQSIPFAFEFC